MNFANVHAVTENPLHPKEELPDSRLRECDRKTVQGPLGLMAKVYCANCGRDGGLVTEEWSEHMYYLCDRCAAKGIGREEQRLPDDVVRGQRSDPILNELLMSKAKIVSNQLFERCGIVVREIVWEDYDGPGQGRIAVAREPFNHNVVNGIPNPHIHKSFKMNDQASLDAARNAVRDYFDRHYEISQKKEIPLATDDKAG